MQNAKCKMQRAGRWSRQFSHFAFCILNYALHTSCSSAPPPIQVSQSGAGAYETALATDDAGFAVAWYDVRDGNAEIYLRLLDESGRLAGPERRLTETPDSSYEASLERLGGRFIIAWYEQTTEGRQTAMLGAWTRDGDRKWTQAIAPDSRNPVIRTDGHAIVAAWIQSEPDGSENVWVGSWAEDGKEQRTRTRVGPASKTTWNLNLDLNGSDTWVAFDAATSTRSSELFVARVDASGVRLECLTRDDGASSKYPDLAVDGEGRVALTWYDMRDGNDEVYLFVGRVSDLHGELDDRARRITTTEGESIGAYVAWNAGRVGLAWSDKTPGAHEVYFQSFDSAGMPLGSVERLTRTETWSLVTAIRPWRKGFALAWTEYRPASSAIHDGTGEVAFTLVE
jgi:hypothetical protein